MAEHSHRENYSNGGKDTSRPNPPQNVEGAIPLQPETAETIVLSPEEIGEQLIKKYIGSLEGHLLLDDEGRRRLEAIHLKGLTRSLLGPLKIAEEPWQEVTPDENETNKNYENFTVNLVAAASDTQGTHHLFISVINSYNQYIIPRPLGGADKRWDLESPLFESRSQFVGLHFEFEIMPTIDGSVETRYRYINLIPDDVTSREVRATLDGEANTLPLRLASAYARDNLSKLPPDLVDANALEFEFGAGSGDTQIEILGTNRIGERVFLSGHSISPIHFAFVQEIPFSAESHDAFQPWIERASRTHISTVKLCEHLFKGQGATVKPMLHMQAYSDLCSAIERRLKARYCRVESIDELELNVESIFYAEHERTGALCLSYRTLNGNYCIPCENGNLVRSEEPAWLVLSPRFTQSTVGSGGRKAIKTDVVSWLVRNMQRPAGAERFPGQLELNLAGIACSESLFAMQMDLLARTPEKSMFEPGLGNIVRAQLTAARLPTNLLDYQVIDFAGDLVEGRSPQAGAALIQHRHGKSVAVLVRDPRSGYIDLQGDPSRGALFMSQPETPKF